MGVSSLLAIPQREVVRGEAAAARPLPRSSRLLHVAAGQLRSAVHPVLLRLRRILLRRAGINLRGQRDGSGGNDQRGNEGLEHNGSPWVAWAAGPIPAACKRDYARCESNRG